MPQLRPDGTPYPYDVRQAQLRNDRGFMGKHGLFRNAVLPTVGFALGGAALGAAGGGAGAASLPAAATEGIGFSAAPAASGGAMTLGKIWDIGNLGLQGASAYFGQRGQNRALDRQIQMQERQIAAQLAADAEARAEAKRQFDAQQANTQRQFAADDEERAYSRRLMDEREARLAPRRAASRAALSRLGDFLGVRF